MEEGVGSGIMMNFRAEIVMLYGTWTKQAERI